MFVYRKLQESIISKAIEYDIPIIFINPKKISSICPRCKSKIKYIGRLGICHRCRFRADRDKIGAMNIWMRVVEVYAGVLGLPPKSL